jgi:hypothetical protein
MVVAMLPLALLLAAATAAFLIPAVSHLRQATQLVLPAPIRVSSGRAASLLVVTVALAVIAIAGSFLHSLGHLGA